MFPTYQCLQNGVFFNFVQILNYLQKSKRPGFYTLIFYIVINNSRSKQNKKNPKNLFVDIVKQETCAKFQQKILNFMVVGTRQNFQFFRQITWFLGNNRALPKFRYWILYNLISITKLLKKLLCKSLFYINRTSHLNV